MKRIVARFEDEEDARAAESTLRDEGLDHHHAELENPIFDPTAPLPEARGLFWGALLGGFVGLLFFQAIEADILWVPRWSPMMSAGEYAVPFLGLGLGVAIGDSSEAKTMDLDRFCSLYDSQSDVSVLAGCPYVCVPIIE